VIQDPKVLEAVRESWSFAVTKSISISAAFNPLMAMLNPIQRQALEIAHNTTLLFAFSVLEKVLEQLADEGCFACKSRHLSALMEASKGAVPWQNFAEITAARERRNAVAHRSTVLSEVQCWDDIASIREELVAWGVVEAP
jgi:hypothetical protein